MNKGSGRPVKLARDSAATPLTVKVVDSFTFLDPRSNIQKWKMALFSNTVRHMRNTQLWATHGPHNCFAKSPLLPLCILNDRWTPWQAFEKSPAKPGEETSAS